MFDEVKKCIPCKGSGKIEVNRCNECCGEGVVPYYHDQCAFDDSEQRNSLIYSREQREDILTN